MKFTRETRKNFHQKLIRLSLPAAFQNLMLSLVAAADAFMLGGMSQNMMSAVSLASQIQFVQNLFLYAITSGAALLGSQYFGKGDRKALDTIFAIALRYAIPVSVLFFSLCEFAPRMMMTIFTNEEELIEIGASYLKIAGWSYLLTGISQCYLVMFKVSDHVGTASFISSVAVVVNIVLNAIFIFGLGSIPPMYAEGAAFATLIARILELILCVGLSLRKDGVRFRFRAFFGRTNGLFGDFTKSTLPILGAQMFWGIGFTSYATFLGHLGVDAAAANSVTTVVRDIVCCVCDGLAIGAGVVVGNELGADRLEEGKLFGNAICSLSFVIGFLQLLVMVLLIPILERFVHLSDQAVIYFRQCMLIMAFYMIGRSANTVTIVGVLTAGGDTFYDFYTVAATMWGFAIPLAALGTYVFHWPVWLVYLCTCVDELGKLPWLVAHFKKYRWVRNITR